MFSRYRYHHYPDLQDFMQKFAKRYPSLARLYSIGTSVQGRELYVLEISDNPGIHEPGKSSVFASVQFIVINILVFDKFVVL